MENSCATHETPLHLNEIGVWRAMSHSRVVGPVLLKNTINSECYNNTVYEFLGHHIEMKLPECGSNKTVQHVLQHGWPCVRYPYCSDIESLKKKI
jgi:hypothetical protein